MKKLIILFGIIGVLVIVNLLFNNKNSNLEKNSQTLAETIFLEKPLTSIIISKDNNQIRLVKKSVDSCFEIVNLDYCVDNKKLQLLKKFISNDVKDIYEKNEDNLKRLGFKNNKNNISLVVNNKRLYFGNINKYNEVYVLQENTIYKIEYIEGILETTSSFWFDKSVPLLSLVETDEFDIEIYNSIANDLNECAIMKHNENGITTNHLTLRNSFFDLYPSDAKKIDSFDDGKKLLLIKIKDPNSNKEIFNFFIWKEEHVTYFLETYPKKHWLKFHIPNSVYENVKSYCQ